MKQFEEIRQRWKRDGKKQVKPLRLKQDDLWFALFVFVCMVIVVFAITSKTNALPVGATEDNQWEVVRGNAMYADDAWDQAHASRYVGETQFKGDCVGTLSTGECEVKLYSYYHGQLASCYREDGGDWEGWIKGISRWNPLQVMQGYINCSEVTIKNNPLLCSNFTYCTQIGSDSDSIFRRHFLDGVCTSCYN